jgi:hypothetical protein
VLASVEALARGPHLVFLSGGDAALRWARAWRLQAVAQALVQVRRAAGQVVAVWLVVMPVGSLGSPQAPLSAAQQARLLQGGMVSVATAFRAVAAV